MEDRQSTESTTGRLPLLLFSPHPRPETTGTYCLRAMRELGDVRHIEAKELGSIDVATVESMLHVDDGHTYRLPEDWPFQKAYWAIDTHLDADLAAWKGAPCDIVFTAQRDGVELLKQRGIPRVTWLPLACDPDIHGRQDLPLRYNVAFIGNLLPGERERLLRLLAHHYPIANTNNLLGHEPDPQGSSFIGRAYFQEMAAIYSQARNVFNRSIKNDVNMRVFEGHFSHVADKNAKKRPAPH